jgi:hypothetical protein
MFIAPLLIIAVLVIAFPRLMKFLLTISVFGPLLVIASCIDHARAEGISSRDSMRRCLAVYAQINTRDIIAMKAFGADSTLPLAQACGGYVETYVFLCQQRGNPAETCLRDVREDAEQAVAKQSH